MPGTVTETVQDHRSVRKTTLSWTSDASGDVSGTTSSIIVGQVLRVVTNPDGTDAPTTLYDVVLNDEDGVDVAAGNLADLSATASAQYVPDPAPAVAGTLEPVVSAAGDTKKGTIVIYWR